MFNKIKKHNGEDVQLNSAQEVKNNSFDAFEELNEEAQKQIKGGKAGPTMDDLIR